MSKISYNLRKYSRILGNWWQTNRDFWDIAKASSHLNKKLSEDVFSLREKVHEATTPIFVLSTGRAGSKLLTKILELNPRLSVHHNTDPELEAFSNISFQNFQDDFVKQMWEAARYETIRDHFLLEKKYVETNNRISTFCYAVHELYPNAKFIHLFRDATHFVRSGYSRNWYGGYRLSDDGRLQLDHPHWQEYSQIEKITWFWCVLNQFIVEFGKSLPAHQFMVVPANRLFSEPQTAYDIHEFVDPGFSVPPEALRKLLRRKINAQPVHRKKTLNTAQLKEVQQTLQKNGFFEGTENEIVDLYSLK